MSQSDVPPENGLSVRDVLSMVLASAFAKSSRRLSLVSRYRPVIRETAMGESKSDQRRGWEGKYGQSMALLQSERSGCVLGRSSVEDSD